MAWNLQFLVLMKTRFLLTLLLFNPMMGWAKAPDTTIVVTHAATIWDANINEREGIPTAIRLGHENHYPVLHLYREDKPHTQEVYPFMDCKRDHCVKSEGGELKAKIKSNHVIAVGGNWGQCLDQTLDDLMWIWGKKQQEKAIWNQNKWDNFTLTLLTDGIYIADIFLRTGDPYLADFKIEAAEASRSLPPDTPQWSTEKLSLAKLLELIKKYEKPGSFELRSEFLKRKLPRYIYLHPSYHVVLRINHEYEEVIQTGNGEAGPHLFIDYM